MKSSCAHHPFDESNGNEGKNFIAVGFNRRGENALNGKNNFIAHHPFDESNGNEGRNFIAVGFNRRMENAMKKNISLPLASANGRMATMKRKEKIMKGIPDVFC
jgi:hypothetical protein